MLSERKMELERRVHAALEENELLQNTVDDLRERTLVLERQCHEKDLQVETHETQCHSRKGSDRWCYSDKNLNIFHYALK